MPRNHSDVSVQSSSMKRRQFITGAAAAAATIVKPSLVWGSRANSRIKTGVIGLGGRGAWIARHLKEHGGYEITAIADYFPEVAEKVGEELGVPEAHRFSGLKGYRRLVETDLDAVFCETPPYCFPEHVTAAVEAGRHVFMAKPVACDVPGTLQVAAMAKKAKQNKRVVLVDFQTRTDPFYIEAIRRVHAGDIGLLGILDVVCGSNGFNDPPKTETIASRLRHLVWVNDIELGGGHLVNYDIHAMDVALWIAGQTPIRAMGCGRKVDPAAHGNAMRAYSLTYECKDGLVINHRAEHLPNLDGGIDCYAYGKTGVLETKYAGHVQIRSKGKPYKGGECKDLYGAGMRANVETFHKSVTQGDCSNPTVEPSINATLTTILGREAALRKTMLTWDQMLKENRKLDVNLKGLRE